jgi:long-chain acyl-CoA synthetase
MGGIGLIAAGLNIPVVPIRITGLFELKTRRRFFALPGELAVTFGEPVNYRREDPDRITKDLEARVKSL